MFSTTQSELKKKTLIQKFNTQKLSSSEQECVCVCVFVVIVCYKCTLAKSGLTGP